jgi:Peptidase_C39 like family
LCILAGMLPTSVFAAASVADRVAGRIVLDVHRHGEGWYVDPVLKQRVALGRPADAFVILRAYGYLSLVSPAQTLALMQSEGLGITSEELATIPVASDVDVRYDVGYFRQAPLGDWGDRRQAEGCEESVALMAVAYARGETMSLEEARDAIIAMSDWEREKFGYYVDTSVADTRDRLLGEYLGYNDTALYTNITVDDIREQLTAGNLVIVPVSGVVVNRTYAGRAPVRHTVLVTGYDADDDAFLVHDPAAGSGFTRISASNLQSALMDYASGDHAPIGNLPHAMVVVALP